MFGPFWAPLLLLVCQSLAAKPVPGCPSVDVLEQDDKIDEETLKNLLLCFCQAGEKTNVAISCLYGSNPDHLKRATDAVKNASMTTTSIHIQHMDFPETGLPNLGELAPELINLEVRDCSASDPLAISPSTFKGLESKLQNLTIHGCNLMEVPSSIDDLTAVRNLDLSGNKLQELDSNLFKKKKMLKYLDISNNQLGTLAEGTFANLEELETLVAGEHNFMNESFLAEIGELKQLRTLDLSRADGLFEPPMELFNALPNLEELKLSGCSIPKLDPGVFAPLKNLKMLDLRVNLIENISAYAFDGLGNLERLTLAGNYIRNLEKDTWVGLDNLQELDIGWNELEEIPSQIFSPLERHLRSLNIRHNAFTMLPTTGLPNLETLLLSECKLDHIDPESLAEYSHLEKLDLSGCELTSIGGDNFKNQKDFLKVLDLSKNHLKGIPSDLLTNLPVLEEIDVSRNPYICDDQLGGFISAVNERYKISAKEGKDFLLSNGNETLCARPWSLKGQLIFDVEADKLVAYDENTDTTTTAAPPTTGAMNEEEETTTLFTIPNLFVGSKTNESLFKEEPRRDVYDLSKVDNTKGSGEEGTTATTLLITFVVLSLITVICVSAVALFIKKRRTEKKNKVAPGSPKKSPTVMEDGMEEIELNTRS